MDFNTNYSFKNMFFKSYSFEVPITQAPTISFSIKTNNYLSVLVLPYFLIQPLVVSLIFYFHMVYLSQLTTCNTFVVT
jgi:hypothetical protein